MQKILDIEAIKQHIPHRYPFLLIDKVTEIEVGKKLVAIKNVSVNEPFFSGHFPEKPVMPGVLILEALAQASGVLIFQTLDRLYTQGELFYLAGINQARFKRMVVPGDVLELQVVLLREGHGLWKFRGEAYVEGQLACQAEFMNIRDTSADSKE